MMNVGMLWYDPDKKTSLRQKVDRAVAYYLGKYGRQPNVCYVHPRMLTGEADLAQAGPVAIRKSDTVMMHHLWLGVEAPA